MPPSELVTSSPLVCVEKTIHEADTLTVKLNTTLDPRTNNAGRTTDYQKNRRRRLQDARCETKTAVTIKRFIYQPHPRIAAAEAARVADTQQI